MALEFTNLKTVNKDRKSALLELRAELCRKIALYMGSEEIRASAVPGLNLVRHTSLRSPVCVNYEPSVAVIAQGRKQVILGGRTFVYDESRYLLTSLDLPITSQITAASEAKPFLALVLKLEMSAVREILSAEEIPVPENTAAMPAMATGEITAEFLGACCRLVDLLQSPRDIPFLSGLLQREIIYRILQGAGGARLRAIATQGDQSHRTAKAIAWLKTNYAQPLRVEDLAGLAQMGISTFHHHFRSLTAMSPLQYQKRLRLNAARQRLLSGDVDAASAAFEVGYESPSQFNREYRRFFGQPPMRDVKARLVGPTALQD